MQWVLSICGGGFIAVVSLAVEHEVQDAQASVVAACGLNACSSRTSRAQAQQLWHMGLVVLSMWDIPGSGIKPVSPALAGGFLTTDPSGRPTSLL